MTAAAGARPSGPGCTPKPLPYGFKPFGCVRPEPELVSAARDGDRSRVIQAIRYGNDDINACNQHVRTALHEAADGGHASVVRTLMDLGRGYSFDINKQDNTGKTALAVAAASGSSEVLKVLLQAGADPKQPDAVGVTPLMMAAEEGNLQCLRILLGTHANSPDVDASDQFGCTALMKACGAVEGEHSAALLLNHGASPNGADQRGRSALHLAAMQGRLDLVKQLHLAGADLQSRDWKGLLAVDMASNQEVAEYLEVEMRRFALYRQQFVVPLSRLPVLGDSGDSLTLRVVDMEKGVPLVLKFFRHKAQRNRMLEIILQLEQDYVASVPADAASELPRYVFKDSRSYKEFPFCLALFAGERTLEEALSRPARPRGPGMPLAEVKHIFRSLAECLEHIHRQGIVHCNMKPSSVMRFYDGHFRLVSMGNACAVGTELEEHTTTLEVCPPEVAKAWLQEASIEASPARDVWALGCILYEMLVGRKLLSDLIEEAEAEVSAGEAAPPAVPRTELLGVLYLIFMLKQDRISELVSAPRLMQCRREHVIVVETADDGGSPTVENSDVELGPVHSKSRKKSSSWMKNLQRKVVSPAKSSLSPARGSKVGSESKSGSNSSLTASGTTITSPPRRVSAGPEVGCMGSSRKSYAGREAEAALDISDSSLADVVPPASEYEVAVTALSELLSKMLRVDPLERPTMPDILKICQALGLMDASIDVDVMDNMKTLKRAAAETQQQMHLKWLQLDAQMKDLLHAISVRGSSSAASNSFANASEISRHSIGSSFETSTESPWPLDGSPDSANAMSPKKKSASSRLGSSIFARSRRGRHGRAAISMPAHESTSTPP